MGVYQAGEDVEAGGLDRGIGGRVRGGADGGDAAVADGDVGDLLRPWQYEGAAAQQQVEVFRH